MAFTREQTGPLTNPGMVAACRPQSQSPARRIEGLMAVRTTEQTRRMLFERIGMAAGDESINATK